MKPLVSLLALAIALGCSGAQAQYSCSGRARCAPTAARSTRWQSNFARATCPRRLTRAHSQQVQLHAPLRAASAPPAQAWKQWRLGRLCRRVPTLPQQLSVSYGARHAAASRSKFSRRAAAKGRECPFAPLLLRARAYWFHGPWVRSANLQPRDTFIEYTTIDCPIGS